MNIIEQAARLANGMQVIMEWLGEGAVTVSQEEAQRRADICLACPMNTHSGTVTEAVARAVKHQVEIKNQLNLRVQGEQKLGKCAACLCETKLKIWLPLERIKPTAEELPAFDQSCWLRETIKN
jgi:hypothetical protein